LLAGEDSNP